MEERGERNEGRGVKWGEREYNLMGEYYIRQRRCQTVGVVDFVGLPCWALGNVYSVQVNGPRSFVL